MVAVVVGGGETVRNKRDQVRKREKEHKPFLSLSNPFWIYAFLLLVGCCCCYYCYCCCIIVIVVVIIVIVVVVIVVVILVVLLPTFPSRDFLQLLTEKNQCDPHVIFKSKR